MQQMKHQEELIDKHKAKWYKIFPYPMPYVITQPQEKDEIKKRYFVVDILSYFYYYIFLIFRYKFPIVAYELGKEVYDFDVKQNKEETKRFNNRKQSGFAKYLAVFSMPLGVWINRAFGKYISIFVLFNTSHAHTYNMIILLIVFILVLYEIIKRTNELKKAFKLDGVKKYKIRVRKNVKAGILTYLIILGLYIFLITFSLLIFTLPPKDQLFLPFTILLSFMSVYFWWFLLCLPYLEVEEVEILKELEY